MLEQAVTNTPQPEPAAPTGERPTTLAPLWHLAWALGVAAAGSALLTGLGQISWRTLQAMALAAIPGLVGYVWRPQGRARLGLLALWAAATAAAAILEGGAAGPIALWCAGPLLAGALMGALAEGALFSAAAIAVVVLVQLAGVAPERQEGVFGIGLAAAGLLLLGAATAGAFQILARRAQEGRRAINDKRAWLIGMMRELPHQALALDRDGSVEAIFGAPVPGLTAETLGAGLVEAVRPEDRAAVQAAICEALDHGFGRTMISPAAAPNRRFCLDLRRRHDERLTAIVHDVTEAQAAAVAEHEQSRAQAGAAPATDESVPALAAELASAEAARDEAVQALSAAEAARISAEGRQADAEAEAAGKGRFLANMSHELRTPLNAIMGFSDIMRSKMFGELPGKYGEYAELIHESGRHLLDLINDVLDISKIDAGRYTLSREQFDVREAVNAALRLVRLQADENQVQLRGILPQQPVEVDADRRAVKQIVLNLVSNALKFTPRGGSITVTAQPVGDVLELVVADTGVGIAKADLERLGQPFEQAGDAEQRNQGTGLGLSLVRAFAHLHGGEMTIESELGEGAAVTVRLPVLVRAEPPAPVEVAEPVAPVDEAAPLAAAEPEVVSSPEPAEMHEPAPPPPEAVASEAAPVEHTEGAPEARAHADEAGPKIAPPPRLGEVISLHFPR